ncbi:PP2C family serine/threonine-protein phosphatase [Pinibacter aurantiacus]|uniref:Protein phosphatase 2C domain-containing protein n=1 Tax=Pinibacter aurantiacus TaxID=2851599 RepID=A0A9E2S5P3_9BACT|nr:PP2C family serine/threonine-protein phosphatase [Pinibacter aurantiacus]MBV4356231.1 protein phosphatase 2C domain-containing protein [Pinibacter aurantiacus]
MMWKAIGQSAIGTSHLATNKSCEDAIAYKIVNAANNETALICCVSDGAGSAAYAEEASTIATQKAIELFEECIAAEKDVDNSIVMSVAENIYDVFANLAEERGVEINEFSSTFLGCILLPGKSVFFQIGDGAIIRDDGNNGYAAIWWPQNGEYSNTTVFLVDDINFPNLKITTVNERINEVAIITDGLQHLTLNNETSSVHGPFFSDLFKWLRMAKNAEETEILNNKLREFLSGQMINSRTDDDKTLFLATTLNK